MISSQWLASYNKTKSIKQQLFLAFYSKHLLFVVQACDTLHSSSWASQSILNKLIQHQAFFKPKISIKCSIRDPFSTQCQKMDSFWWLQHQYIHQPSNRTTKHQEVDLSTIHQPILQLTTVTSETCTSKTIGIKILCVFLYL